MTLHCARGSETLNRLPAWAVFTHLLGSSVWGGDASPHRTRKPAAAAQYVLRAVSWFPGVLPKVALQAQKPLTQTRRSGSSGGSGNLSIRPARPRLSPLPTCRPRPGHAPRRRRRRAQALATPSGREAGGRGRKDEGPQQGDQVGNGSGQRRGDSSMPSLF